MSVNGMTAAGHAAGHVCHLTYLRTGTGTSHPPTTCSRLLVHSRPPTRLLFFDKASASLPNKGW